MQCRACGHVFSNPQAEIDYGRLEAHIANYLKHEKVRRQTSQWRLKQLDKYDRTGRLLEIGSSGGFFLDEARKLGFEVTGVELNQEGVKYSREVLGLTVYDNKDITTIDFGCRFDVVAMFNLLEHVFEPTQYLRYIVDNVLAPEGILLIEVPNIFTLQAKLLRSRCHHLSWAHYSYYSKKTFNLLAEKVGIEVLENKYGKRIYPLGYSLKQFLGRARLAEKITAGVLKRLKLYDKVISAGLNEFLFFICKKK
jgi:2-polyprenyl-3-methyl-5-hydroxy-6-metoxy-1,4-benzoquinol methylase